MTPSDFRKELVKIMPGCSWTVHKQYPPADGKYMRATGIQSIGFNRLSTFQVVRRDRDGAVEYEVKSAGFGKRAPWLSEARDGTLARALRALQNYYEHMAALYGGQARTMQAARKEAANG